MVVVNASQLPEPIKIIQGDNLKVMPTDVADNSVDLTVTSPPYDNLRTYGNASEWGENQWKAILQELFRVTKKGGVVVWVVSDSTKNGSESLTSFKQALCAVEIGFKLHDTMIYLKDNPVPVGGNNRYYQAFEYMLVFSKGTPKTFNPILVPRRNKHNDKRTQRIRGVNRSADGDFTPSLVKINENVKRTNVWTYVVGGGNMTSDKIAYEHPAIFPEKLALDHILSWSNEGDVVFDPFMGSGTVGKMAMLNKRQFIGIENNPEYFQLAMRRIYGNLPL